jgi:hypothetical protein
MRGGRGWIRLKLKGVGRGRNHQPDGVLDETLSLIVRAGASLADFILGSREIYISFLKLVARLAYYYYKQSLVVVERLRRGTAGRDRDLNVRKSRFTLERTYWARWELHLFHRGLPAYI